MDQQIVNSVMREMKDCLDNQQLLRLKMVFITTAKYSSEARTYVEKQLLQKIVLVDGKDLTDLMIEFNLGVTTTSTYEIKRVDYDFFQEDL